MAERMSVETCRWAKPTIRAPFPQWLEAESKAWTCFRDAEPRALEDPSVCQECPRWQPHRLRVDELQ